MNAGIQYLLMIIFALIVVLLPVVFLGRIKGSRVYHFENVIIGGLVPLGFLMLVALGAEWPRKETFEILTFLLDFPAQFANLSMGFFILLGIAMGISNLVLMKHEGMAFKNTIGTLLNLFWLLATLVLYGLLCWVKTLPPNPSSILSFLYQWLPFYLYCLIDYGECIMVGLMIMGWIAARGKSAYDKDFIIIPGCSISKTGGLLPLLRGRVNRAMRYAWEQEIATGKPVCFVPSGGQGRDEVMSEGSAMAMYLLSHSAEDNEILAEKESRNTRENFLYSAKIIRAKNKDAKVAFATTNYHVLRCGMLAEQAGLSAEGLASSTKWYFWPNGFAREVVAIVNMTRRWHLTACLIMLVVSIGLVLI